MGIYEDYLADHLDNESLEESGSLHVSKRSQRERASEADKKGMDVPRRVPVSVVPLVNKAVRKERNKNWHIRSVDLVEETN